MERFIEFAINHYILVSLLIGLLIALMITESRRGGRTVSTSELTQLVNKHDALVLDIRDPGEFKQGHITGARNIPYASLKDRLSDLEQHKSVPVVLVCKMGQHSGAAGKLLRDNGFTDVRRLSGGIGTWTAENLPLVKSS